MGSHIMIACILVIGLVGSVMNYALTRLFEVVTPWKAKEVKKGAGARQLKKKGPADM
jgi:hypothetical protein